MGRSRQGALDEMLLTRCSRCQHRVVRRCLKLANLPPSVSGRGRCVALFPIVSSSSITVSPLLVVCHCSPVYRHPGKPLRVHLPGVRSFPRSVSCLGQRAGQALAQSLRDARIAVPPSPFPRHLHDQVLVVLPRAGARASRAPRARHAPARQRDTRSLCHDRGMLLLHADWEPSQRHEDVPAMHHMVRSEQLAARRRTLSIHPTRGATVQVGGSSADLMASWLSTM
jgi:hypothetical protein